MELRVLKYFLTVAAEGNITRAADILHVTQPTLSRQLMELEDEMGTALLIRGKRSVTLTEEGFLFKQQAETIVELADKLEHTFVDQKDNICGTIRIGATEAAGSRTLAVCMKKFREKYPDVQFDLYNGMADNIKEMIEHGLLDLGLVMEPIDTAKFEYVRFPKKEIWGILIRQDHELAQKETVTVEEIVDETADEYDVVFVGSPNWCGTIAPPIGSWLGENHLTGKKVLPFFSHCGGEDKGMEQAVRKLCTTAKMGSCLYVLENGSEDLHDMVQEWLKQNVSEM